MNRSPGKNRIIVADRGALARLSKRLDDLGVLAAPQPTIWRLKHRKSGAIDVETHSALEAAIIEAGPANGAEEMFALLHRATLPPFGTTMLRAYASWNETCVREFFHRRAPRFEIRENALVSIGKIDCPPVKEIMVPGGALKGAALARWANLAALRAVVATLPAGAALDQLARELDDGDEDLLRFQVALLRILGPLLEGPEAGFMEPLWEELDPDDLNRFVKRGVERERLLMRYRGPRRQRVRRALQGEIPRPRHRLARDSDEVELSPVPGA